MKDPKIYSIEDLMIKDFDDEEIDIVSKSLIYSLVIGMFRYIKNDMSDKDIIKVIKSEDWYDKYSWTKYQYNEYEKKLNKVFYNLYRFGPIKSNNSAKEFMMKYGFQIKTLSNKKSYNKKNKAQ